MRARTRRLWVIGIAAVLLSGAGALALTAIRSSAMYYYSPSDLDAAALESGRTIRLGGLVEPGSLRYGEGAEIIFLITDGAGSVSVRYVGLVPDLFREGQGVIADGAFDTAGGGVFVAERILAKHDENYVPRELKGVAGADPAATDRLSHPGKAG